MEGITVALVGNPNSGKTTIFNSLTRSRQHVGNYPGVTVEIKEGSFIHRGYNVKVVDLPGTYSLTAFSPDEMVARSFIVKERPNLLVDIIDSSNLERNLYLSLQLIEMGIPVIFVFNMSDEAKKKGYTFDIQTFSEILRGPVVETVGHKGKGIDKLKDTIIDVAFQKENQNSIKIVDYGKDLEAAIEDIVNLLRTESPINLNHLTRWFSVKLLENDEAITKEIASPNLLTKVAEGRRNVEKNTGKSVDTILAEKRYEFISYICRKAVRSKIQDGYTLSDKIDRIVLNRLLGIPIFLGLMYLVFTLVFKVGEVPMGWIESFFANIGEKVARLWPEGSEGVIKSLLIDGAIGGVGTVLTFLPNIILLFFAISLLEDTGYMARAAFVMDRFMNKIGLHGKSFIPMLLGFGCSVPAIMATRTIESKRDRLITMLVIPLMSCGARLPIYTLIIPAFFSEKLYAVILWSMYLIGIVIAVISAKILSLTVFKGESGTFILELPPYRMPTLKNILLNMWHRAYLYLKRAGTIILGISIMLWAMAYFPKLPEERIQYYENEKSMLESTAISEEVRSEKLKEIDNRLKEESLLHSLAGRLGRSIEWVLSPMGFDWRIGTALLGAFFAKEVFVAQLGVIYSLGSSEDSAGILRERLRADYSPLVGFCIMLFCLIAIPCMATTAVTARESGSWKWAILQSMGLTCIAYVITTLVYQVGSLFHS